MADFEASMYSYHNISDRVAKRESYTLGILECRTLSEFDPGCRSSLSQAQVETQMLRLTSINEGNRPNATLFR